MSGRHDPVVLFTGQMGKATQASFSYDSWRRNRATCTSAPNSIAEVKRPGQRRVRDRGIEAVSLRLLAEPRPARRQPPAHPHGAVAAPQDVPETVHVHARVLLDLPQGRPHPGPERLPLAARPEPLRHLVRLGRLGPGRALLLRPAQAEGMPRLPPSGLPLRRVRQQEGVPARPRASRPRTRRCPSCAATGRPKEDARLPPGPTRC